MRPPIQVRFHEGRAPPVETTHFSTTPELHHPFTTQNKWSIFLRLNSRVRRMITSETRAGVCASSMQ